MSRQTEVDEILRKHIWRKVPLKYEWIRLAAIRRMMGGDGEFFDGVRRAAIRRMMGGDGGGDGGDVERDVDIRYFPRFSKILIRANNMTEGWGGKLYFVYLPEFSRYNKDVIHDQYRKKLAVIELVKNLNIPVIDIHQEVFSKHTDPLSLFPFRRNGHYTAKGYSRVANEIIKSIAKIDK